MSSTIWMSWVGLPNRPSEAGHLRGVGVKHQRAGGKEREVVVMGEGSQFVVTTIAVRDWARLKSTAGTGDTRVKISLQNMLNVGGGWTVRCGADEEQRARAVVGRLSLRATCVLQASTCGFGGSVLAAKSQSSAALLGCPTVSHLCLSEPPEDGQLNNSGTARVAAFATEGLTSSAAQLTTVMGNNSYSQAHVVCCSGFQNLWLSAT